jgi:transposase
MDDTAGRSFFTQPQHSVQRRYEAIRAIVVDGRSQREVAECFGFAYRTMRQMVYEFRQGLDDPAADKSPFFRK